MARLLSCDRCGEIINPADAHAALAPFVFGQARAGEHSDWRRDYHADPDRDCIGAVLAAVEAAHSFGLLPVTTEGEER